jgi:DNA-binding XRE family transcriptional regulator
MEAHEKDEVAPKTEEATKEAQGKTSARAQKATKKNAVRKMRTERMMSKAELARRAGLSTLTIDRVERGMKARMDTKRKILEALGLKASDRVMVFGDAEED